MKNFAKVLRIITLIVVIGFSMIACDNGGGGGDDVYKLTWGVWMNTTYSYVASQFTANGVTPTPVGSNAGYLTGKAAQSAYSYIQNHIDFDESGELRDTFENLLNYKKDGIELPQDLKTTMSEQKGNTPVGGIFQASTNAGTIVVAFYVENGSYGGDYSFTVNSTNGSLTITGFPSKYEGKNIGAWCAWNDYLDAYEDITVNSAKSITFIYGAITNGSVTLKVWDTQNYFVYNNFNKSGNYHFELYTMPTKTLTDNLEEHDDPVEITPVGSIDVSFTNGVGAVTVDASNFFDQ